MMHEENIGEDEDAPRERKSNGAASEEAASEEKVKTSHHGGSPTGEASVESPWEPGVVQVEFSSDIMPDIVKGPEPSLDKITSLKGRDLLKVNQFLAEHGLRGAALTFRASRDEAARLQGVALQQGIDVPNLSNFVTLYFSPEANVEQITQELAQMDEVAHAWPVPRSEPPAAVLNDPLLGTSDQLPCTPDPDDLDTQWYIFRCRADRAWRLGYTGEGVVLADIDWGYQVGHPELLKRLHPLEEHCHNSVDGGTKVDFPPRIDHGTAVLGLAGAGADGFGMVGFAHKADLLAIQANAGNGPTDGVTEWVEAFRWVMAKDVGVRRKIILLERTAVGGINIETERTVNVVIRTAIANGVVICVTAGNGGRDAGIGIGGVPIELTSSILVGATCYKPDRNERASFSNFGPRVVVAAPGDDEHDLTCDIADPAKPFKNDFGGTSGAAAKVAGAVALMLEANPYMRHSDVRRILYQTGTHVVTDDDKPVGRFLDCEAAVQASLSAPAWGTAWRRLPGSALDLVFAPDGSAWHLSSDYIIYRWDEMESLWLPHGPAVDAVRIAVGASLKPWYVDSSGDIFRWTGSKWQQAPSKALDLRAGANGSIWRVGTDNHIYSWVNAGWQPDDIYSSALKVAVEPDGNHWHISSATGDIYRRVAGSWQQVPGKALDICVGANGSVWRIGLNVTGDGNSMSRWNGCEWEPIDGAAATIAIAPNGLPWHSNQSGHIFRRI